jgi:drug/metabolite transporter (DMT)-like permease
MGAELSVEERESGPRQVVADSALVLVALIWGSTFVMVKDVIREVPPIFFLGLRFASGAITLALVLVVLRRWRGLSMREVGWGGLLGVFLYAGYVFQTLGLQTTTASNAGFITGLYVVMVPFLGIPILKQVPGALQWLGVGLATVGLALLSFRFNERGELAFSINSGDALVLCCTIAFALHLVYIARVAGGLDPLRLAFVQIVVCALLCVLTSIPLEPRVAGLSGETWAGIAFLGVVATALAIALQVSMQRFTSAVHAVLIFSLEPVFAALFGVWLQDDRLQIGAWVGAGLILSGMLVAELGGHLAAKIERRGIIGEDQTPP